MNGVLYGVSVGPGDPQLMTLAAVACIQSCKAIAFPTSAPGMPSTALQIAERAIEGVENKQQIELIFPMHGAKASWADAHQTAAQTLSNTLAQGIDVAFLILGDASIYSTYSHVAESVKNSGFTCKTIAGVPSFCAAAALVGEELTDTGEQLHVIPAMVPERSEALDLPGTKVIMKVGKSFGALMEQLRDKNMLEDAWLVTRCGMQGERAMRLAYAKPEDAEYFSLIIIKERRE